MRNHAFSSRYLRIALGFVLLSCAAVLVGLLASGASPVATVASANGEVSRDFRGAEGHWRIAALGEALYIGDAVRTDSDAFAVLSLENGATMALEPKTVVRFLEQAPNRGSLRVESGLAAMQTGERSLQIETAFGLFELAAGTAVRVEQRGGVAHLRVDMGRASFIDPMAVPHAILPGDEIFLKRDEPPRFLRRDAPTKPGDELAGETPLLASTQIVDVELRAERAERAPAAPSVELPPGPTRADVTLRAGELATVHEPGRATNVRVSFQHLCGERSAIVDVAGLRGQYKPRVAGAGAAVFRAGVGMTRYRVRCADQEGAAAKVVASGRVRVVRDAAVRRVPLKPPTNVVDLDGRRYTVMYQNRLPSVVVRAPGKGAGRMVIKSGSRLRTLEAVGGAASLASGELGDGQHEVFFESVDGRSRTQVTRLSIAFDNAAPMASIDQQGDVAPDDAGHVHLTGVVPLGSRVSLEGQALKVDGVGRFSASAVPGVADSAVSLRVEHPRAGLHYYVRRVQGAGQ